jgi:hypothetical protein
VATEEKDRRKYDGYILRLGHVVTQSVEALRYEHEVRGFDSRWSQWSIIFIDIALPVALFLCDRHRL